MKKIEGIKLIEPEQTDQEYSRDEVLKHFPKMTDPNDPCHEIVKRIHDETNGNIPQSLKRFAREIKDPLDLVVIGYLIGQQITESAIENTMNDQIPVLIRESMKAGAKMAMQHLSRDPDPSGSPFPVTDPSVDPQYQ